jgi:hypothetical protein
MRWLTMPFEGPALRPRCFVPPHAPDRVHQYPCGSLLAARVPA